MTRWHQNEPTPAKRRVECWLTQDDGVTPAVASTNFLGTYARRALSGSTGVLTGVILQYIAIGSAGNAKTIQFVADGAGVGSVTVVSNAITFHFQTGVTTVNNAITALAPYFTFTGTYTGSNVLTTPGDVFGPLALAGGTDPSIFLRTADALVWVAAVGTLTNTGIDGDWVYEATQGETNHLGNQGAFRVTRAPDLAALDLSTKTINCATIVQEKTGGTPGNSTTLAFVNDGAGAGTLNESAYPAIVFHYQAATTTVKNFEDAVVASTHLAIKQYGKWTNVLAVGDAFAATNLAGGLSYAQFVDRIDMILADLDALGEGTHTYGDLIRLLVGIMAGTVIDFRTGTLVFKSLDGTKTRATVTTDASGRTADAIGDLT